MMNICTRFAVLTAWCAAAAVFAASVVQAFPTKPIKIIVPFGAGGVADLTARTVAQHMQASLGQSIVDENRPGAGGFSAAEAVVNAEPDGHTLLLISNGTAVSAGLFKSPPVNAERDLHAVGLMSAFDLALVVPSDSRFAQFSDVLSFAKANPGKLNLGTINIGSTQHLAAELLKSSLGVDLQVVPFNGTPALIGALRGGTVDAAIEILGPLNTQISAKAVRLLATLGAKRNSAHSIVPTASEAAGNAFAVTSWNGFAVSAKVPSAALSKLNQALNAALAAAPVRARFNELNVVAMPTSPEQANAHLASETKRWSEVIRAAKIAPQ